MVKMRVTPEERLRYTQAADDQGLSEWLRAAAERQLEAVQPIRVPAMTPPPPIPVGGPPKPDEAPKVGVVEVPGRG